MSTTFSQTPGTVTIKPICAEVTDPKLVSGKMRLFCKVRFGRGLLETTPDLTNGKKPVWSSTLKFSKKTEDSVRIELFHKNLYFKPKYLGECHIPLDAMVFIAELHGRCDLLQDGKRIGYLDIQIKWEPENGVHPSPITRASFLNNSSTDSLAISGALGNNNSSVVTLYQSLSSSDGRQAAPRHIALPHLRGGSSLQRILENFNEAMRKRMEDLQKDIEPEEPNLSDEERCVVCLGKRRTGAFYRCGHNCCCTECGVSFIGSRCPVCRELVFDFIKIYQV